MTNCGLVQGLPRGRETELFAQDLLDRLPSTNGSARPSQNQLRERQVDLTVVLFLSSCLYFLQGNLVLCWCNGSNRQ